MSAQSDANNGWHVAHSDAGDDGSIDLGDGPDTADGNDGYTTYHCSGGDDWIFAAGGEDRLLGFIGNDHLYGGASRVRRPASYGFSRLHT